MKLIAKKGENGEGLKDYQEDKNIQRIVTAN